MMDYTISGTIAQYATLNFEDGEEIWLSNSSLMSYSNGVSWNLAVPGGFTGAVRRSFSGEGMSLTKASATGSKQHAIISANSPGHIVAWPLNDSGILTTRGSFLAAWGDIDINVTMAKRAGAALFGGAGLFLQQITGTGMVLVHGNGDLVQRELGESEEIIVSSGNLAAFEEQVDYDVKAVGSARKFFFSGEGLFMTKLQGPGRVVLQSLKPVVASTSS